MSTTVSTMRLASLGPAFWDTGGDDARRLRLSAAKFLLRDNKPPYEATVAQLEEQLKIEEEDLASFLTEKWKFVFDGHYFSVVSEVSIKLDVQSLQESAPALQDILVLKAKELWPPAGYALIGPSSWDGTTCCCLFFSLSPFLWDSRILLGLLAWNERLVLCCSSAGLSHAPPLRSPNNWVICEVVRFILLINTKNCDELAAPLAQIGE